MALCKVGWFTNDMTKIKTTHQRYVNASTGLHSSIRILITVFDIVNHSVLFTESNGITILERMGNNMLKWYGHVVRMEDNGLKE